MMNFAAPPLRMCSLPGPWHDSQPLWPGIAAFSKCKRACGLIGNFRTISAWQPAQALLPTKCAPGISSGATTVVEVVEQEIKKHVAPPTNTIAKPPANFDFCFNQRF
jgi:hypothetical protein